MQAAHQPLFKARGIRVNAVSPGPVVTPIFKEFRQLFGDARVDDDIARVGRAGHGAGYRAAGALPVLRRRPLDQRRQSAGRWRSRGLRSTRACSDFDASGKGVKAAAGFGCAQIESHATL